MEIQVRTSQRNELIDITAKVENIVEKSGVKEGLCIVWCPHTTAGITINENADPDVKDDILMGLSMIVSSNWPYRHIEGNSDAHLKSSIIGCEKVIVIENNSLKLGTWQGLMLCEFDGPRNRRIEAKIIRDR